MSQVDKAIAVGTLLLRKPLYENEKARAQLHVVTNTDAQTGSIDSMAVLEEKGERYLSLGEGSLNGEDITRVEDERLELELMISMALARLKQQDRLTDAWEDYYRTYFSTNYKKPAVKIQVNQESS